MLIDPEDGFLISSEVIQDSEFVTTDGVKKRPRGGGFTEMLCLAEFFIAFYYSITNWKNEC